MRLIDARRLSPQKKQKILDRDGHLCGYCMSEADEVDHIVPWSYRHNDSDENLIASCWLCNMIASNKMFDTIAIKRAHILARRERIVKETNLVLWLEDEINQLGRSIRGYVRDSCLVAKDIEEADRILCNTDKMGLLVKIDRALEYALYRFREKKSPRSKS